MKLGIETGLAADKKKEVPVVHTSSFAALCQPSHKGRPSHTIALEAMQARPHPCDLLRTSPSYEDTARSP